MEANPHRRDQDDQRLSDDPNATCVKSEPREREENKLRQQQKLREKTCFILMDIPAAAFPLFFYDDRALGIAYRTGGPFELDHLDVVSSGSSPRQVRVGLPTGIFHPCLFVGRGNI